MNVPNCTKHSMWKNIQGSFYCMCKPGYSCGEDGYCTGNKVVWRLYNWLMYCISFKQILMSVLWTLLTTVPMELPNAVMSVLWTLKIVLETVLNASILPVVMFACACQATQAMTVKVMNVLMLCTLVSYIVFFQYRHGWVWRSHS